MSHKRLIKLLMIVDFLFQLMMVSVFYTDDGTEPIDNTLSIEPSNKYLNNYLI